MSSRISFIPDIKPFGYGCCTAGKNYRDTHIHTNLKDALYYHNHPDTMNFEICDGCDEKHLVIGQRMDSSSSQHQVNLKS